MPIGNRHLWMLLGLAALTLVPLGQVVGHDFIRSDDPAYVVNNPHVHTGFSWDNARYAFTDVHLGMWLPLTFLSLQLDAALWWPPAPYDADAIAAAARGFHLTNLTLHLVNVLLLYWLVFRLTGSVGRSGMVAALFAIHPLHVESVAWVTERKDVLSTFFLLLTLLAYLRWCEKPGVIRYLTALGTFLLALGAKPMVVSLPCLLLLLDFWPLRRLSGGSAAAFVKLILEKIPFFMLAFLVMYLAIYGHGSTDSLLGDRNIPIRLRLANAVQSVAWYVIKTLLPWNLGAFYPQGFHELASPQVFASIGFLAALLGVLVWAWIGCNRREQATGWLWFLIALGPVLGLVVQAGDQARADRFVYIPHIGLFLALVWAAADFLAWAKVNLMARTALAGGVLVTLGYLTWLQAGYWRGELPLWQHTLAVTGPDNYRAQGHLAIFHFLRGQPGDDALAEAHVDQAFDHSFKLPELSKLKGYLLIRREKWAEAIPRLEYSLRFDPTEADVHEALGKAHFHLGDFAKARLHWWLALASDPNNKKAQQGMKRLPS